MGVRYCKCGAVLKFRCQICDDCRVKNYKESMHRCHDTETEKRRNQKQNGYAREYLPREGYAQVEVAAPWVRKVDTRTEAEIEAANVAQRELDKAIDRARLARAGLLFIDAGRCLSREEIDQEQARYNYQPAQYIRDEVILPWAKRCAAEPR